jgi:glycosyltransferase involved in cell wall biosynthesis
MRVAVVAEYYPRRRDPVRGIWAHRQALATDADIRVFVLERFVPPVSALRKGPGAVARAFRELAAQPRVDTIDGIEVEYVRFVAPPYWRSYASWHRYIRRPLARAIRRAGRFDLIHAHYALPAGGAVPADLPLVVSVHGGDVLGAQMQTESARAEVAAVLRRARVVMCNSKAMLERAEALGATTARVVHLGASAPSPLPEKHAEPTVATLAHVDPRKRHEDVAAAVQQLGLRWVVIGDGPELASLDGAVRLGQLPPDEALRELARCHVMALPSIDEAFGVAYIEALACGVPAIGCAGEGGPEEIAALGGGMLLVPPREPDALARAIRQALDDPSLPDAARANAREHFSWEACGRATLAAYEDALR